MLQAMSFILILIIILGVVATAKRRIFKRALFLLTGVTMNLTAFLIANNAYAATYYVANNGSDAYDGLSLTTPFQTIGHAKNVVNPGDTIEIREGTYTENGLMVTMSGTPNAWITMRAYNNEQVTLRSTGAGPTLYFYHSLCDGTYIASSSDPTGNVDCHPHYWIVQGLTIQGSPNGGTDGFAVKIDTPKVHLIGNKLCCTVADVVKLTRGANDVEILDNEILQDLSIVTPGGNAQGIDIVGADRTRIAHNYVHDINDYGMYAKGNARNTIFENNYMVNIGMHGIMLGQATGTQYMADGNYETYDGIARNNVIVGTGWACLATSSSFSVHFYNNSCYNTGNGGHGSILLSNESVVVGGWPGTNIEIKNNIIYSASNSQSIYISNYGGREALSDYTTLHIDKNIYYVSSGSPIFSWNGTTYTIEQWRPAYLSRTGQNDTSLVADPQYASTTMLTLNPGSPAINAGLATPYVTTDYLGTLRPQNGAFDIGAYEVVDTAAPYVVIERCDATVCDAVYNTSVTSISISGTAGIGSTAPFGATITSVAWSNDKGGSGNCTGTTSWACNNISLQSGQNTVTITVADSNGKTGIDMVVVNQNTSGGGTGGNTSSSGGDSSASGGSGCGYIKDNNGKGQGAKGEGASMMILLIITLTGISLARRLTRRV